ncbi:hypothetical protein FAZ15_06875 [Sphingobacterium olei]|uniref:DUF5777 domain-containing protein n=1 Tax=Sphingobacterium olei TaxID=2571155 RepID=A0A4U0P672_9SPHI|nr:DUF5777 family beta-barrel protein [Sphingobacterium olei]TJZ62222.1 hypothetical protein FAZ15_06875 [Sphingobacterium olei]
MKLLYLKIVTAIVLTMPLLSFAQEDLDKLIELETNNSEKILATFKSGNLINIKTTETIHKNEMDFRVDHRFGDLAGRAGGVKNFFGMDHSTDIRIGFDYGLFDNVTVGIARAKGATAATQLYEMNVKYRFLDQTQDNVRPISIAFFASTTAAAVGTSNDPVSPISYGGFGDRLTYISQFIIARKFSPSFSFAILPTYTHRNYTAFGDQNSVFAIGAGGRLKISKRMAVVADYFLPFRNQEKKQYIEEVNQQKFYNALGVGLELETGGHIFHLNFTNATAVQESQFITETTSTWTKGQFRWGFSIARRFSFAKNKEK